MRSILFMLWLTLAVACGANDPPVRPAGDAGIKIGAKGVSTNSGAVATNGTFKVGLSL
ncbi:MAG: hypothetical protein OSA51_02130 [Octadecabacter sp.]|nr:hypothetical protein [Octadecabacter sp.]